MSINLHVNVSISVVTANSARATFGILMFVHDFAVGSGRQLGPYSSLAAVEAAGFTTAAEPECHAWAAAVFAQRPRATQVMFGRRTSASENLATTLSAIEAEDPAAWYCTNISSRSTVDCMALATWTESRAKIAVCQSDDSDMLAGTASTAQTSTLTVGGTATDGVYSAQLINDWTGAAVAPAVTVTRAAGVPATNTDIADALATALEAVAAIAAITSPINNSGATIPITFTGLGNHYSWTLSAPAPGTLTDADSPGQVQNPGELLEAGTFTRTALIYHDDDTEYLDGAWTARCLGFNLDAPRGAGAWSYQVLAGQSATRLTDAEKDELIDVNCNYYAPVRYTSGVEEDGFTFPGVAASGRFIDISTTIDLLQARMEEAFLGVFLSAASSSSPRVPYTDAGIALFEAAASRVFSDLTRAGHFAAGAVSTLSGEITPRVVVPAVSSVSSAEKAARRLTLSAEAVFAGSINSVGDGATVGFTIELSF